MTALRDPEQALRTVLRIRVAAALVLAVLPLATTTGLVFLIHGGDPGARGFDLRELAILTLTGAAAVVLAGAGAVLCIRGSRSLVAEGALWVLVPVLLVGGIGFVSTGTWPTVLWLIPAGCGVDLIRASRSS